MPAGSKPGERRGGRKKGQRNHASIAREREVKITGSTPLDVITKTYRRFENRALSIDRKALRTKDKTEKAKLIKEADDLMITASYHAEKAAPFIHPKLATLQSNVNLEGRLTLGELVQQAMEHGKAANSNTPAQSVDKKDEAI